MHQKCALLIKKKCFHKCHVLKNSCTHKIYSNKGSLLTCVFKQEYVGPFYVLTEPQLLRKLK